MAAAIHYCIKTKQIRHNPSGTLDFIEAEKKFEAQNPIEAREAAFIELHKHIVALLKAGGKKYTTDKLATEDLLALFDAGLNAKIKLDKQEVDFSDSFGLGIGVFLVVNKPIEDTMFEERPGDDYLLYGIGRLELPTDAQTIMKGLNHEIWHYRHHNYDTKNHRTSVSFYEYDIQEAETYRILATPFDWSGYDKPYLGKIKKTPGANEQQILKQLVFAGENNQLKFKPTLVFNLKTSKPGIGIKGIIAKTICAFLNSNGGILFIGITDEGVLQGLYPDFSLADGKDYYEYFMLEYEQMVDHFLSFPVKSKVCGEFQTINGKELFAVTVSPSRGRPIFLNGKEGKEFYIRHDASTKPLHDIEEIASYCIARWGTRSNQ